MRLKQFWERNCTVLATIIVVSLVAYFLFFSFSLFRKGSVYLYTDVARDFLLMEQLANKKPFFIGGRTSLEGVFHGPLWHYINAPAYILTNGDPVLMQWYWIAMTLTFLILTFFAMRDIYGTKSSLIIVLLLSINMLVLKQFFTNPIIAFFTIPFFLYTFIKYFKTHAVGFLIAHVLVGGVIVQSEMAIGFPLLLLSGLPLIRDILRTKRFLHILSFAAIVIPLCTFIIFETRHDFLQTRGLINYATGAKDQFPDHKSFAVIAMQKWELITSGALGVFPFGQFEKLNILVVIALTIVFHQSIIKREMDVKIIAPLYFFIGSFVLSFLLKDTMLFHYFYPLISLPIILYAGVYKKVHRYLLLLTLCLAVVVGIYVSSEVEYDSTRTLESSQEDWKFLTGVAQIPFESGDESFGYFVYSPDVYAYQLKYALLYQQNIHPEVKSYPLSKQNITYLIMASPTGTGKELSIRDWKRQKVRLDASPSAVMISRHGYQVEQYMLSDAEKSIPPDFDMTEMLYFR